HTRSSRNSQQCAHIAYTAHGSVCSFSSCFLKDLATPSPYPLSPTRRSSDLVATVGLSAAALLAASGTAAAATDAGAAVPLAASRDRKSTRLNSSHRTISYAVFCLKKKSRGVRQRLG